METGHEEMLAVLHVGWELAELGLDPGPLEFVFCMQVRNRTASLVAMETAMSILL